MGKKIRQVVDRISEIMEWIVTAIILISIVVAIISLWPSFQDFVMNRTDAHAFREFLGRVLNVVIGIEFVKMLCKPDVNTVLEVLMFVIVRHMVVIETSAVENLLTIVGIAVIFAIKKYLQPAWQGGRHSAEIDSESERDKKST